MMTKPFGKSKKTDNSKHGKADKIAIRKAVLSEIPAPVVFDAFAGSGEMYRAVWHNAGYVGCDQRFFRDDRTAFVADNRRVMRSIDLGVFNIYDFDSYGGPWEQCLILADRRPIAPGERIGLVLTEGSRMRMTFGVIPNLLAYLAGTRTEIVGGNHDVDWFVDRAIDGLCKRWRVNLVTQWRAESRACGAARPLYIGMILEGISGVVGPGSDCYSQPAKTAVDRA